MTVEDPHASTADDESLLPRVPGILSGGTSTNPTEQSRQDYAISSHADTLLTGKLSNGDAKHAIVRTPARTTFHTNDIDAHDDQKRRKYERLWRTQMGFRQTYENDSRQKTRVRENATRMRCDAILQFCETPAWVRKRVVSQVYQRALQGFSRHYQGADGACIGFALLELCESPVEAKDTWLARRAKEAVPGFDEETVSRLVDYVFRKYGGAS